MKHLILLAMLMSLVSLYAQQQVPTQETGSAKLDPNTEEVVPNTAPEAALQRQEMIADPDTYIVTKTSGDWWSARGAQFGCALNAVAAPGTICTIDSDSPKAGYRIRFVEFKMIGSYGRVCAGNDSNPRPPGSWTICFQESRGDLAAQWRFQIQGRSENNSATACRAFLTTTYQKIKPGRKSPPQ